MKKVRDRSVVHRRVHADELENYLMKDASKRLKTSTDRNSLTSELSDRNQSRSSIQSDILKQRIIPVDYRQAAIVHDFENSGPNPLKQLARKIGGVVS